jgi:hypothetical protein
VVARFKPRVPVLQKRDEKAACPAGSAPATSSAASSAAGEALVRGRSRRDGSRAEVAAEAAKVAEQPPSSPSSLSWAEGAAMMEAAARKSKTNIQVADDDDDVAEFVNRRLEENKDEWPDGAPPPPSSDAEALNLKGRWSAKACGVEIRACGEADKGLGAFAVKKLGKGQVVGIYWGEVLTMREHALRHGWRTDSFVHDATSAEQDELAARATRLGRLQYGMPVHGAQNGSSYCFCLRTRARADPSWSNVPRQRSARRTNACLAPLATSHTPQVRLHATRRGPQCLKR